MNKLSIVIGVLLIAGTLYADTSSVEYLGDITHRVRQADDSWKFYQKDVGEIDKSTYETVAIPKEELRRKQLDQVHPDVQDLAVAIAELTNAFTKADLATKFLEVKQRRD